MAVKVVWHTYQDETIARGYWDQGLLEDIFARKWECVRYEFEHYMGFDEIEDGEGAIVVIPARHNAEHFRALDEDINKLRWCLLILTGDEESVFQLGNISHPNIRYWLMSPNPIKHTMREDIQYIGSGYPPQAGPILKGLPQSNRSINWFFSGQVTHPRREQLVRELERVAARGLPGECISTPGFTQGLSHEEYYGKLNDARVALCPSGPVSVDSFRFYEALEAGCVPIVESHTPEMNMAAHWEMLFPDGYPFTVVDDWGEVRSHLKYHAKTWPLISNRVGTWWEIQKRNYARRMRDDLVKLGVPLPDGNLASDVTVLVSSSPIPSNPSTKIIEHTIESIREQLPDSDVIIMLDGVRSEQAEMVVNYDRYIENVLWLCRHEWSNVFPVMAGEHKHQARMTRDILDSGIVDSEFILFVEHDTPMGGEVGWQSCVDLLRNNMGDVVRFHHEAIIPESHWYLMPDGGKYIEFKGERFLRTQQWSQRPHLASAAFYRAMLHKYFSEDSKTMIEDRVHSLAQNSPWGEFRLWIYYPPGNCCRSWHTDGREGEPKFEMEM